MMFASDLDNTLLFSHRYRQPGDICVEYLDGKEQGFFTQTTIELLRQVSQHLLFIPVTTRSIKQYQRIQWPAGCQPKYAVTTNGAILLVDGEIDLPWIDASAKMVDPWREELAQLQRLMPTIPQIKRFRMVDDMYLFAACDNGQDAQISGALLQDKTVLDVAVSGRKVYVFPPFLNKGRAIDRLRERFSPKRIICAGDSVIDIPMLHRGDSSIIPHELLSKTKGTQRFYVNSDSERFPDFVMNTVLQNLDRK